MGIRGVLLILVGAFEGKKFRIRTTYFLKLCIGDDFTLNRHQPQGASSPPAGSQPISHREFLSDSAKPGESDGEDCEGTRGISFCPGAHFWPP